MESRTFGSGFFLAASFRATRAELADIKAAARRAR